MTTAYTSLLGLALPVTGELSGTWGDTVNDYITSYLDAAIAGAQTISGSQTAVTLSKTTGLSLSQAGSGATGSSQYQIINCTGNPAGLLTITAPAASKVYLVINSTSTSQSVKVVGVGPTTGVTILAGERALIAWNGSDFVNISGPTLASDNTWTGTQTFTDAKLRLLGSSTGYTTFDSANSSATNYTLTIPAATDTMAVLGQNQTFTGANTFGNATGQTFLASSTTTQDGLVVTGRAGGTLSYRVTLSPTTLTASRAVTFPDAAGAVVIDSATQTLTNKTLTSPTINNPTLSGTLGGNLTFSGSNTFGNASGQLFLASTTTTQDGVILNGRAGGTLSYRVTIAPTTLTASRTVTLPDAAGTVVLDTATQTLTNKTLTTPVLSATGAGTTAGQLGYSAGVFTFGNGTNTRTVETLEDTQTISGAKTFGNASGQLFLASTTTTQDGVIINGRAGGTLSYRVTIAPTTLTASRSVTLPDAAGTVVLDTATQTLTNKTIDAASNTLTGVATLTGTQTLTNKTLTTPILSATAAGTTAGQLGYSAGVFTFGNGTATRTIATLEDTQTISGAKTFGNAAGQLFLASTTTTQDGVIINGRAGGTTSLRVTISPTTLTASRAVTLPDADGAVVIDTATQTLTNKTMAYSSNTMTGFIAQGATTIYVPALAMVSRTTNGAAIGTTETSTNDVMIRTLDFDASTAEYAQFAVRMPKSWNEGTITAFFLWSNASGTGSVVWAIQGTALSSGNAIDTAWGTAVTTTSASSGTNTLTQSSQTTSVTIGNTPAENDLVTFQVYRDATSGSDTLAADARLHGVVVIYTTNAANDA